MPIIETAREDIRSLQGVHLFHFATSNCSQRVRLALEEKGANWISHHIDLLKCENATPEFIGINPKGLVPVLIHDGVTITESNDIIRHVDTNFDGPKLRPAGHLDDLYLQDSLQHSSDFQAPLKLLTHEFLFKPFRRMNEQQLADYAAGTGNPELIDFMREFSSNEGFSRERIVAATQQAENVLSSLEARLGGRNWLTGEEFGLTDISWVVNIHRLSYMRYPTTSFPLVTDWLERVRARQAFKRAIYRFESRRAISVFFVYSILRAFQRTSIRNFIPEKSTG